MVPTAMIQANSKAQLRGLAVTARLDFLAQRQRVKTCSGLIRALDTGTGGSPELVTHLGPTTRMDDAKQL